MAAWSSMQTLFEGYGYLGFSDGVGKSVRSHNGTVYIHAHRCVILVSLHVWIPNTAAVQSSIQQGTPDFHDFGREKGEDIFRLIFLVIHTYYTFLVDIHSIIAGWMVNLCHSFCKSSQNSSLKSQDHVFVCLTMRYHFGVIIHSTLLN